MTMMTLYGSGSEARAAYRRLSDRIGAVVDPWRAGGELEGLPVRASLRGLEQSRILVASMHYAEICERLLDEGTSPDRIRIYFRGELTPLTKISGHVERVLAARRFCQAYFEEKMAGIPDFSSRTEFLAFCSRRAPAAGLRLEFGVLDGASIDVIAAHSEGTVHGFDSFEGLPADWTFGYAAGALSREGRLPEVRSNVSLVPGWFEDRLPGFLESHTGDVALVHLDADLYESTRFVLDRLGDRIVEGTVLVFDEYLYMNDPDHDDFRAFQDWRGRRAYRYLARCGHRVALRMGSEEQTNPDRQESLRA